jgi:hypothetical protein
LVGRQQAVALKIVPCKASVNYGLDGAPIIEQALSEFIVANELNGLKEETSATFPQLIKTGIVQGNRKTKLIV